MTPFIFAADGKAIATAPCRSRLRIDTTRTRTGFELSRFRLECANDPRNRRTFQTADAGMAAARARHRRPCAREDTAHKDRLVRRLYPSHSPSYRQHNCV